MVPDVQAELLCNCAQQGALKLWYGNVLLNPEQNVITFMAYSIWLSWGWLWGGCYMLLFCTFRCCLLFVLKTHLLEGRMASTSLEWVQK